MYTAQMKAESKISVSLVGVSGYAGLQLTRILLRHPKFELTAAFSSQSPAGLLSDYFPESVVNGISLSSIPVYPVQRLPECVKPESIVFLATPTEVSIHWVQRLLKSGATVIDLSGAFRLSAENAQKFYGLPNESVELLAQAHYGLQPWNPLSGSASGRLISNPGCYSTSVLMAVLPLLKGEPLIDPTSLVIDAKSGATGAGKKLSQELMFCEAEGECLPYKVGKHQHLPEIREGVSRYAHVQINPFFTTHLLGARRGILAGIYAKTLPGVTLEKISAAFEQAYSAYPLVRHGRIEGGKPSDLSLKRVVGTPRTEIRYELHGNQLYLFSLIDNLMKGAASQAVENLNSLFGLPLTTGLENWETLI